MRTGGHISLSKAATDSAFQGAGLWNDLSVVLARGRRLDQMAFMSHSCKPRPQGSCVLKKGQGILLQVPKFLYVLPVAGMPGCLPLLCCSAIFSSRIPCTACLHPPWDIWGLPMFGGRPGLAAPLESMQVAGYSASHSFLQLETPQNVLCCFGGDFSRPAGGTPFCPHLQTPSPTSKANKEQYKTLKTPPLDDSLHCHSDTGGTEEVASSPR